MPSPASALVAFLVLVACSLTPQFAAANGMMALAIPQPVPTFDLTSPEHRAPFGFAGPPPEAPSAFVAAARPGSQAAPEGTGSGLRLNLSAQDGRPTGDAAVEAARVALGYAVVRDRWQLDVTAGARVTRSGSTGGRGTTAQIRRFEGVSQAVREVDDMLGGVSVWPLGSVRIRFKF